MNQRFTEGDLEMNDEIRVSIQSDQGIKNQWARGFFYRRDGLKNTLVSKHFGIGLGVLFSGVTVSLFLQSTPDEPKPKSQDLGILNVQVREANVAIPPAASSDRQTTGTVKERPTSQTVSRSAVREKAEKFTGPQVVARPRIGKIPPGVLVKAVLLTGASSGPVRAEVTEALTINGEPMIAEGTVLLGNGQSGEDRLSVRFSQMLFKDGGFESIDAQACDDSDKIAGLKGSKVGGQALKLATGIGLNFAAGAGAVLQDTAGENGAVITRPTLKNALLNGAATASLDQSREMMSEVRNKPPVIEVPQGTPIFVLFSGQGGF